MRLFLEAPDPLQKTPARRRLLLVDDDRGLAAMLHTYLSMCGYELLTATTANEAYTLFQRESPDLVLLDIHLPEVDGFEIYRHLRQFQKAAAIPAIFLTEITQREARLKGLELGAVDFISKPFDLQELALRIANITTRANRQHEYHPITGLLTGRGVVDQVAGWQYQSEWAMLWIRLSDWQQLSEQYGFMAANEVLRAFALLIQNISRPLGNPDLLCQLAEDSFLLLTQRWRAPFLRPQLLNELNNALPLLLPNRANAVLHCRIETFSESNTNSADWEALQQCLRTY